MIDTYHRAAIDLVDFGNQEQDSLRLKVTSQSMFPLLRSGDYIVVKPTPLAGIQRGDLVVTRREDGYLTHRLLTKEPRGWLTKGDRNREVDTPVNTHDIIGIVVAVERLGKTKDNRTYFRIMISRWLGWLYWQETICHSTMSKWPIWFISRVIRYCFQ